MNMLCKRRGGRYPNNVWGRNPAPRETLTINSWDVCVCVCVCVWLCFSLSAHWLQPAMKCWLAAITLPVAGHVSSVPPPSCHFSLVPFPPLSLSLSLSLSLHHPRSPFSLSPHSHYKFTSTRVETSGRFENTVAPLTHTHMLGRIDLRGAKMSLTHLHFLRSFDHTLIL